MKVYFKVYELEARQDAKELKKAVKREKGIKSVDINIKTSIAKVKFDEDIISQHRVKIAFLKAGHIIGVLKKPEEEEPAEEEAAEKETLVEGPIDEEIEVQARELARKLIKESMKTRRQPHEERIGKARVKEEQKLQKRIDKHKEEHEAEITKQVKGHKSLIDRLNKIRKKRVDVKTIEPEEVIDKLKAAEVKIKDEREKALRDIAQTKKEDEERIKQELERQREDYERRIDKERQARERLRKELRREKEKRRVGLARSFIASFKFFKEDVKQASKSVEKKKEEKRRKGVVAELDKVKERFRYQKERKEEDDILAKQRIMHEKLKERLKEEKLKVRAEKKAKRRQVWKEKFERYKRNREEKKALKEKEAKRIIEKEKKEIKKEVKKEIKEKQIKEKGIKEKGIEKKQVKKPEISFAARFKKTIYEIKAAKELKAKEKAKKKAKAELIVKKKETKKELHKKEAKKKEVKKEILKKEAKKEEVKIKKVKLDSSVMPEEIGKPPRPMIVKDDYEPTEEMERLRIKSVFVIIFTIPLLYISLGPMLGFNIGYFVERYIILFEFLLATPLIMLGYRIFLKGIRSIINRKLNTYTLISVATGIAYIYSLFVFILILLKKIGTTEVFFDVAGLVIAFVLIGYYIESRIHGRVISGIKRLVKLKPKIARMTRDLEEIEVPLERIKVGDIINVGPNETIPFDGTILEGYSVADESMVTGSWNLINKEAGDKVIGGTLNKEGAFNFKVENIGNKSLLMQLVHQIMNTYKRKASFESFLNKAASLIPPLVAIIAVIVFVAGTFKNALSVLIIACPVVFGLSVTTAVMVAATMGIKQGILIKGTDVIHNMKGIKAIVVSKAGVMTGQRPHLLEIISYGRYKKKDILKLAASAESVSEHPIAKELKYQALVEDLRLHKTKISKIVDCGVQASIKGSMVTVGRIKLMQKLGVNMKKIDKEIEELQSLGKTIVVVAIGKKVAGVIVLSYQLNAYCKEMVADFHKMKKKVIMVTGDNDTTAKSIAAYLGMDYVMSGLSANEKVKVIRKLQEKGKVAYVGDSRTDFAAISQSDVGISFDSRDLTSSDDIVLLKNSLLDVVSAFRLGKCALGKMRQNISWSYLYNFVGISLATGVCQYIFLNPVVAGILLAVCPLVVMINSLSIKWFRPRVSHIKEA